MGMVKGKIPLREVAEYDPNIQGALGAPRIKTQKKHSNAKK